MKGMMIRGSYSVAQRGSGTQSMNCGFGRNALLANTALILLGYIRGVFVHPCPRCKLLGGQTHCDRIPELSLSLPETNRRNTTKQ